MPRIDDSGSIHERAELRKAAQHEPHETDLNPTHFPGVRPTPSTVDPLVAGYLTLCAGTVLFLIVLFLLL
jgi:hypothetical protein